MKKRYIGGALLAAAASYYAIRMTQKIAADLARYDTLRAMSNEGPVLEETPDMLMQILVQQQHFVDNWVAFFKSLPKDIVRYTKIEAM